MLLGLTGKKRSGKDSFARAIYPYNFVQVRFADTLKNMLRVLLSDAGFDSKLIESLIEGPDKEKPLEIFGGKSARHAMQTLGTEWGDMVDKELWVRIADRRIRRYINSRTNVIVTDVRRPHEAELLRRRGGKIIKISRPGLESNDSHQSETELESIAADIEVINDSTLEALALKAPLVLATFGFAETI